MPPRGRRESQTADGKNHLQFSVVSLEDRTVSGEGDPSTSAEETVLYSKGTKLYFRPKSDGTVEEVIGSDSPAFTGTATFVNITASGTLGVTGAVTFTSTLAANDSITLAAGKDLVMSTTSDIGSSGTRMQALFGATANLSGIFTASDGSAAAPAISGTTTADDGFYFTTNLVGIAGSGIAAATFSVPTNATDAVNTFTSTLAATNSTTGGNVFAGGLAVAKNSFFGGTLGVAGTSTLAAFNASANSSLTASKNGDLQFLVNNTGTTAGDRAIVRMTNGTAGGDPMVMWSNTDVASWAAGIDVDDGLWHLSGSSVLGTTDVITASTAGVTIPGTLGVAGITSITNATASTSSATGALVVSGGVGIALKTYMANTLTVTHASSPEIVVIDTTGPVSAKFQCNDSEMLLGTFTAHPTKLISNSTTVLTLDTSQDATFAGQIIAASLGAATTGTNLLLDASNQIRPDSSSMRYKENITGLVADSSKIYDLVPRSFTFKADENPKLISGLIAEEVNEVLPGAVNWNSKGQIESFDVKQIMTLMLAEIQNLKKQIN